MATQVYQSNHQTAYDPVEKRGFLKKYLERVFFTFFKFLLSGHKNPDEKIGVSIQDDFCDKMYENKNWPFDDYGPYLECTFTSQHYYTAIWESVIFTSCFLGELHLVRFIILNDSAKDSLNTK